MLCVYTSPAGLCPGTAPLSRREHYLPRALGNFQNDDRLKNKICEDCQRIFSKMEDVFAHNSAEAFFREMIGRVGRRRRKGKNIFYEPTLGMAPLTVKAKWPGDEFEMLFEVAGESQMRPIKQLVFKDTSGNFFQIPFRAGKLTPDSVKALVEQQKLSTITAVMYMGDDDAEREEMERLCEGFVPSGKTIDKPLTGEGTEVSGQMLAYISRPYLQAIAKIGFHYVLQYFPRYTGFEPEFDGIKRFIYLGVGNDRDFVQVTSEQFILEFRQGANLRFWAHLLTAQNDNRSIEARMQFFAGPKVRPLVWRVLVGRDPSSVIYSEQKGNMFRYYETITNAYHGERLELVANTRIHLYRLTPGGRIVP